MKNIPLYTAIGLVAISLAARAARAEDLSTATAPLPPGTFTTSAHSDEWKIANALSAAPATIAEHATVVDRPANPKDDMSHGRVRFARETTAGLACPTSLGGLSTTQCVCCEIAVTHRDQIGNEKLFYGK
jgi:hypothetical protein